MDTMPLTPNGKIDRKALPAPGLKQEGYIAPRNPIEKKLVEVWSDILKVEKEKIGIDDNFFHLGGHSLNAIRVMSRIKGEFGVRVPLVEVFQTPTIRLLGGYIKGEKGEGVPVKDDQLIVLKKWPGQAGPFFFIHDGSGEVEGYIEFCNRLTGAYDFWGIQAQKIESYRPLNLSIEEVAQRYIEKMRKVQVHGPYRIAGWSIGGTIGFEMVRQLEEQKEDVGFLGLIDTAPPDTKFFDKGVEYSLESELEWIREYFPIESLIKRLESIEDFSRVWPEILSFFENSGPGLKKHNENIFKDMVPEEFALAEMNLAQMGSKEFISKLNTLRTFDNSRNKYIPGGKIDAVVHFFKAGEGRMIDAEKWNIYCNKPINVYNIPGDHLSMFKMPGVMELAKLFGKIINK